MSERPEIRPPVGHQSASRTVFGLRARRGFALGAIVALVALAVPGSALADAQLAEPPAPAADPAANAPEPPALPADPATPVQSVTPAPPVTDPAAAPAAPAAPPADAAPVADPAAAQPVPASPAAPADPAAAAPAPVDPGSATPAAQADPAPPVADAHPAAPADPVATAPAGGTSAPAAFTPITATPLAAPALPAASAAPAPGTVDLPTWLPARVRFILQPFDQGLLTWPTLGPLPTWAPSGLGQSFSRGPLLPWTPTTYAAYEQSTAGSAIFNTPSGAATQAPGAAAHKPTAAPPPIRPAPIHPPLPPPARTVSLAPAATSGGESAAETALLVALSLLVMTSVSGLRRRAGRRIDAVAGIRPIWPVLALERPD